MISLLVFVLVALIVLAIVVYGGAALGLPRPLVIVVALIVLLALLAHLFDGGAAGASVRVAP